MTIGSPTASATTASTPPSRSASNPTSAGAPTVARHTVRNGCGTNPGPWVCRSSTNNSRCSRSPSWVTSAHPAVHACAQASNTTSRSLTVASGRSGHRRAARRARPDAADARSPCPAGRSRSTRSARRRSCGSARSAEPARRRPGAGCACPADGRPSAPAVPAAGWRSGPRTRRGCGTGTSGSWTIVFTIRNHPSTAYSICAIDGSRKRSQ